MHNPYRGGTADWWYSGRQADLWTEYKWLDHVPSRTRSVNLGLSKLQLQWLKGRYEEGRSVIVICGCPQGGALFEYRDWEEVTPEDFRSRLIPKEGLIAWISAFTMGTSRAN